ncbi:MAG TPA: PIN domain-containing protein [Acidimicrobiales bacterium]|nr:PIN domain-containing protein [Acidimicrobiales bacterium]
MTSRASVVVDTMVVSALVNAARDPGSAARHRSAIGDRSVVVSFVTVTEMRFGAINAGWGEIRRRGLERALAQLVVVQPDDDLMARCAQLRADCWARGHALGSKIHEADRWVAATAMALGVELVTSDAVFRDVPGLTVRDPSA